MGLSDYLAADTSEGIKGAVRKARCSDGDNYSGNRHAGATYWRGGNRHQRQAIWASSGASTAITIAGFSYLCCASIESVWGSVVCCVIVSLMTDKGNPPVRGFMQNVGGRNTAAMFGWGNFGASVIVIMAPKLLVCGADDGSGQTRSFLYVPARFPSLLLSSW